MARPAILRKLLNAASVLLLTFLLVASALPASAGPAEFQASAAALPADPALAWVPDWLAAFDEDGNRVDDAADRIAAERVAAGEPGDEVPVLVTYDHAPSASDVARLVDGLAASPGPYVAQYSPTVHVRVPAAAVARLGTLPGLVAVEHDFPVYPLLDVSAPSTQARRGAGSHTFYNGLTAEDLGYTGTGMVVAVLDTGVEDLHSAFAGKWIDGADVTPQAPVYCVNPEDDHGHGTHVASLALGRINTESRFGTAKDAKLVEVRIGVAGATASIGAASIGSIQRGFEFVKAYNDALAGGGSLCGAGDDHVDVATVSFGSVGRGGPNAGSTETVIDQLVGSGVAVTIAAGNCGPTPSSTCTFGDDDDGIASPGNAAGALSIGSFADGGTVSRANDVISSFSSRGPNAAGTTTADPGAAGGATSAANLQDRYRKPDVAAPGEAVWGAGPTVALNSQNSGTSMATPHVAGIAALLLQTGEYAKAQTGGINRMASTGNGYTGGGTYVEGAYPVRDALIHSTEYKSAGSKGLWTGPGADGLNWNNAWGYGQPNAHGAVCWAWQNVLHPAGATSVPPAVNAACGPFNAALAVDAGGAYSGAVATATSLLGGASGGTPGYTFSWTLDSAPAGGSGAFANAAAAVTTFTPDTAGSYVLRLTATDSVAATAFDTATLTVSSALPLAVDAGGPYSGTQGNAIAIAGATSGGVAPLAVAWSIDSGPGGGTFGSAGSLATVFTPAAAGTYTLRLTATDAASTVASDLATLTALGTGTEVLLTSFNFDVNGACNLQGWSSFRHFTVSGTASRASQNAWHQETFRPDTPPCQWYHGDPNVGIYDNLQSTSLVSPSGAGCFNLPADLLGARFEWKNAGDLENNFDFLHVEVSNACGGSTWTNVASFTGPHGDWTTNPATYQALSANLASKVGAGGFQLRMRIDTDESVFGDGYQVDTFRLLVRDATPPSGVTGLSVVDLGTGGNLGLSWQAATDNVRVSHYEILRSTSASGPFSVVGTATGTGATDSGLVEGTTYYYRVRAVDLAGLTGALSAIASGTPTGSLLPPHAPVFDPIPDQGVMEGQTMAFGVTARDTAGHPIALSVTNAPAGSSFTDNGDGTGDFRWTTDFTDGGSYRNVRFAAQDSTGATDLEFVDFSIGRVTDPPRVTSPGGQSATEGAFLEVPIAASDPDGDPLTWTVSGLPAGAVIGATASGASLRWVPGFGASGTYSATVAARDPHGASASATFAVTVSRQANLVRLDVLGESLQQSSGGVLHAYSVLVRNQQAASDTIDLSTTAPSGWIVDTEIVSLSLSSGGSAVVQLRVTPDHSAGAGTVRVTGVAGSGATGFDSVHFDLPWTASWGLDGYHALPVMDPVSGQVEASYFDGAGLMDAAVTVTQTPRGPAGGSSSTVSGTTGSDGVFEFEFASNPGGATAIGEHELRIDVAAFGRTYTFTGFYTVG